MNQTVRHSVGGRATATGLAEILLEDLPRFEGVNTIFDDGLLGQWIQGIRLKRWLRLQSSAHSRALAPATNSRRYRQP